MAQNLQLLKRRIKTSKNISQIAKALEMIAAAKIKKAQNATQSQQTKPAQKRRLENSLNTAWTYTPAFIVKAFQKKETYAKAGAPRIISQVPDVHTLNLSMFTYPFKKEFLQQTKWYSPGPLS